MHQNKSKEITFEHDKSADLSASSSLSPETLFSQCSNSDGAGDREFAVRNKTARLVSSSSSSASNDELTLTSLKGHWQVLVKDSQVGRAHKRDSSDEGTLGVVQGDDGLS